MMLLWVTAVCVWGWSSKDQSVTSSPCHAVHTRRLLFDLQLLFAELVIVCNSASWVHLRPKSSAPKSVQCLIAISLLGPQLSQSWLLQHWKLYLVHVSVPPSSPLPSLTHSCWDKLFSTIFTLNYEFFSFKEQFIVVFLLVCYKKNHF